MSQGASQVAWHVAPCWSMITGGGGGEEPLKLFLLGWSTQWKKKKRGSQGNANKDTAQRLSHHTARKLGWVYIGWGRGRRRGEGWRQSEEQYRKGRSTRTRQVCSGGGAAPEPLQPNSQQGCSDADLSLTSPSIAVNSLISEPWHSPRI